MIPRGTIVAALLAIELAIVGEAVVAVRGDQPLPWTAQRSAPQIAAGPQLIEGGPHQVFYADAHTALSVDVGYADLTIVADPAPRIDVSVRASTRYGIFRAKGPIAARADGETVRIETSDGHRWSMGDDRMVTVHVPPDTAITVVNAGHVKANGLRAEASFNSIGRGSVTIEDYDAPALVIESSHGRIELHRISPSRLDVTSKNGRVEGTALQLRNGSIDGNSRVTLGFAAGTDTLVSADTLHGRVNVSGLTSVASADAGRARTAEGASQAVRVGAGNGRLDVRSRDGNVDLAQEGALIM